jgi:hypothetical protein
MAGASTHATTHTLRFTSVQRGSAPLSKSVRAQTDKDLSPSGKLIGYDLLRFAGRSSGGVALAISGGFMYGTLHFTSSPVVHGHVTGGTGAYRGARGTVTARVLNQSGSRTAVTIKYHT